MNGSKIYSANNTVCDGSETGGYSACIHGGEMKKTILTGVTSCTGLTFADTLSAFNWFCDSSSGTAILYTSGLKESMGLRDLLNPTSFKNEAVAVTKSTYVIARSTSSVWWSNLIANAIAATPVSGTIYTVSSNTNYTGLNVNGINKVAIVTLGTAAITASDIFLDAHNINFWWIEGNFKTANRTNNIMQFFYTNFSQFRHVNISHSYALFLYFTRNCLFTGLNISDNTIGINLYYGTGDTFRNIRIFNSSSYGINGYSSNHEVFQGITGGGNTGPLIYTFTDKYSQSGKNTFSNISAINNGFGGIVMVNRQFSGTTSNTISQLLATNNGSGGISYIGGNGDQTAQIASTNNTVGLKFNQSVDSVLKSNIILGNNSGNQCDVNNNPTLISWNGNVTFDSSCTNSSATVLSGRTLASSLVGKVTSESSNSSTSGSAAYSANLDFMNFDNSFRGWGRDGNAFPNQNNIQSCSIGTCRIWDLSLKSSDAVVRNINGAFTAGSACPTSVDGDATITDANGHTYLLNAIEISGMGGNNNGLCESGETCVYQPNIGAYAGEGALSAGTCTFHDGVGASKVTGVKMYQYMTNGH